MRKVIAGAAALAAAAVAGFGLSQVGGNGSPDSATAAAAQIAPGARVSYLVSGSRHTGKVITYVDDTLVLVTDDVSKTTQRHLSRAELTDLTPPATTSTGTTTAPPPTTTTPPPTTAPPPTTTEPPVTTTEPPPPPSADTANVWIDHTPGACTRSAARVAYSDAASCGPNWQNACAAAQAGDTIIVQNGNYGQQMLTCSKTAPTFIVGQGTVSVTGATPGVCVFSDGYSQDGLLCVKASFLTFRNMTLDAADSRGQASGAGIAAANVAFESVNVYGSFVSIYVDAPSFTWRIGSLGKDGVNGAPRKGCGVDGEPLWLNADGATVDAVRFNSMSADGSPCSGSVDGFHLEYVRVQSARNVTITNSTFVADADGPGNGAGSGKIFVTSSSSSDSAANGLRLLNNTFGTVRGSTSMQTHSNVKNANGWQIKGNSFAQDVVMPGSTAGLVACGNTGQVPAASWKAACP